MKKRWTPELIQELKHLRLVNRLSLQKIGNNYGVSRQRVHVLIGNTGFRAKKSLVRCVSCGEVLYEADGSLCCGCESYQEHTSYL